MRRSALFMTVAVAGAALLAAGCSPSTEAKIEKLGTDVEDQVLTAQQQFDEGLSGLDGDASLSDVPAEEREAVNNLSSSYDELNSALGCN